MSDWLNITNIIFGFIGAASALVVVVARLFHNKVVAGKDNEINSLKRDLAQAEARVQSADKNRSQSQQSLETLREQLNGKIEDLAKQFHAQAASLYIPIYTVHDKESKSPLGFAFVAVYNMNFEATKGVLKIKLVEEWTVVGECWAKGRGRVENELQANPRHVASYDQESKFTPVHTLVLPVLCNKEKVGVIQLFNKTKPDNLHSIDAHGFTDGDFTNLQKDATDTPLAEATNLFRSDQDHVGFLELQGEESLENAAIMYVDLTSSSLLFSSLTLLEAAQLINCFNEHVYRQMKHLSAVVERFNGDGTLVRFHYENFDPDRPESNPVLVAVRAAADLIQGFETFKGKYWKLLPPTAADKIRLRICITLGRVISTNVGPRQFQVPTVMGQCVNRSAKMIAYAPRDRDVVLVDGNVRQALEQMDKKYAEALSNFSFDEPKASSLMGYEYSEVIKLDSFKSGAERTR